MYPSNQRSVYLMTQRFARHPYLALFDGPDPNLSTDVRTSATVPLQALYLMNNPFVAEQAAGFAARLMQMRKPTLGGACVRPFAWPMAASRKQTERDLRSCLSGRYTAEAS